MLGLAVRKVGVFTAFLTDPGFGLLCMMKCHPLLVQGSIVIHSTHRELPVAYNFVGDW